MTIKAALCVAFFAALAGCGGGSGGGEAAPAPVQNPPPQPEPVEMGDLAIAVTDAEGDFLVYEVEVERIDLQTAAGAEVQTIPASSRIDFADLTELSELLTVASVPAGAYTAITLQLDFTDAVVMIQDDAGEVREATLQDADGAPLGATAVALTLDGDAPVRIGPGVIARVSLDFDLDASNEILSFDPAVVQVEPFVVAMAELDETRNLRVHGVLEAVADDGSISVEVRPWRRRPATVGSASFTTDAETVWEIDDASLVGAAGLEALGAVAAGTDLVAAGPVADGALVADTVLVGSAVPGAAGDVLSGTVLARGDDDLMVLGGVRVHAAGGPDRFLRRAGLFVGDGTVVRLRGQDDAAELGATALSVGSRVVTEAIEAPTIQLEGAPDAVVYDASLGTVFLRRSELIAEVVSADPLQVDLVRLSGRRPGAYDFSGTGATQADDADPDLYEIDPGVLSTAGLEASDIVRVRGLVSAFGTAAPDFAAESLVNVATEDRAARLAASWRELGGSADALTAIAPDGFTVDLSAAAAALRLRGLPRNVLPDDGVVSLVPAGDGPSVFTLRGGDEDGIRVFEDFASFSEALLAGLQGGELVASLSAEGRYDRDQARLTVRRVRVLWVR